MFHLRTKRRSLPCLLAFSFFLLALLAFSFLFLQSYNLLYIPQKCQCQSNRQQATHVVSIPRMPSDLVPSSIYNIPKRRAYPRRQVMEECPPLFGRILVIVLVEKVWKPLTKNYGIAHNSLDCYIRTTNYTLKRVDLDEDEHAKKYCHRYKNLFFRKHCLAAHYLVETDWMLVLDADTGVVNPNHCIEEWIDERVDLVFYERFFNWEIMSGNYLVRNTAFARRFLLDWAEMAFWLPKFSSSDNGALQLHILKTVLPNARIEIKTCEHYWNSSVDYDSLMAYTNCVRSALGAQRIWPPKLRILRRAHGFARDWFMTGDAFSEMDFMFHNWKASAISQERPSPFSAMPDPRNCTGRYQGWNWRPDKRISVSAAKVMMAEQESHFQRNFPASARIQAHLNNSEVAECYPTCDEHI